MNVTRRTAILLAVVLCLTALPVHAAEPALYPSEVRESQAGEFRRVEKVYLLDHGAGPAAIPTEDFEREGCRYTLLDLLREDHTETETKPHTETLTQPSDTQDMGAILKTLDPTMDYAGEDGFSGPLTLDTQSITVEAAGYKTSARTVTTSRTYPGLSDADTSLIPKSVEENGRTLMLSNVSWQTVPGSNETLSPTYTAAVTYTTEATSRYATGYTVTARYTGDLTRTVSGNMVYTAVFAGKPLVQPTPKVEENAPMPEQPATTHKPSAPHWIYAVGAIVLVLLVLAAIFFSVREFESRRKKELNDHEEIAEKPAEPPVTYPLPGDDHFPGGGTGV